MNDWRFMKTFSAWRTARPGRSESPIVHLRRRRSSVSPIQTVFEPSAFAAIRQSMGLPVDPKQALYNTHRFNGYKMPVSSK